MKEDCGMAFSNQAIEELQMALEIRLALARVPHISFHITMTY